jgi:uncharacterized protein YcgI (DUF1989 family)
VHNGKIFISTGDRLYTKFANPLMTIVEDTYKGKHDMQYGGCDKLFFDRRYELSKARDPVTIKMFEERGCNVKCMTKGLTSSLFSPIVYIG